MAEDRKPEREFKPAINPEDLDSSASKPDFSGDFTYVQVNELSKLGYQMETPAELYTLLADVAVQQGFGDLADSLIRRSKSSMPTISRDPDSVVMKPVGSMQELEIDGTKEQVAKRRISDAVGRAIRGLREIGASRTSESRTPTLIDVSLDSQDDKEVFVALCQILAENPADVETTEAKVKTYSGDEATGQRYDIQTLSSVVGGYDLVLYRHGRQGRTTRTDSDMIKMYLQAQTSEQ